MSGHALSLVLLDHCEPTSIPPIQRQSGDATPFDLAGARFFLGGGNIWRVTRPSELPRPDSPLLLLSDHLWKPLTLVPGQIVTIEAGDRIHIPRLRNDSVKITVMGAR